MNNKSNTKKLTLGEPRYVENNGKAKWCCSVCNEVLADVVKTSEGLRLQLPTGYNRVMDRYCGVEATNHVYGPKRWVDGSDWDVQNFLGEYGLVRMNKYPNLWLNDRNGPIQIEIMEAFAVYIACRKHHDLYGYMMYHIKSYRGIPIKSQPAKKIF